MGCYLFIVQIYVGEISSTENRASFLNIIHIFVHLGIIFIYTLGHLVSHQTMNIIYGTIPLIYAIAFQAVIESPPYLRSKGKHEKAQQSQQLLMPKNQRNLEVEMMKLNTKPSYQVEKTKSLKELLKIKSTRKAMVVMCVQFFFFQMSGTNAINFYAQTIFMEAGVRNLHPGISSIIYVSFLTLNSLSASIFARRFNRRVMLISFNALSAICLTIIGSYFFLKSHGHDLEGHGWIPLSALCINSIAFCHGTASVTWGLLGELFTIEAKKVIAPVAQIVSHALTAIIVLSFPTLVVFIGIGSIFYIFATATAIDIIFAYFFIPETRGKTIEEIQRDLEN